MTPTRSFTIVLAAGSIALSTVAFPRTAPAVSGSAGWGISDASAQANLPVPSVPGQFRFAQAAPPATPPAPAAPSTPVRTERITYDSWTVTCTEALEKGSKKTCSALLQVTDEKQQRVLLVWLMGFDNQGVLRTVIQAPTGVQIPKGVELKFGNGAARTLPYAACTPQNCEASIAMDDPLVREARANAEATATILAVDGRSINFKIGVKGMDKALAALGK